MLTGSGESFFCTALLDTVELAPASAATNGVITVGNLASREVSSSGAEAFTVVELVVESDVALTVVESDTNAFVVLTVVESDTNDFVVLMVAESDTNAFVLLTSVAESAELPVLLLLVLEEAADLLGNPVGIAFRGPAPHRLGKVSRCRRTDRHDGIGVFVAQFVEGKGAGRGPFHGAFDGPWQAREAG